MSEKTRAHDLAHVARRYFSSGQQEKDIAAELKISITKVSRMIKEAQASGVVSINISESFGLSGKEDPDLARQLTEEFELDDSLVVTIDDEDVATPLERDDFLHTVLANQTGKKLKILPNDHLAVGTGRPVNQVARFLTRHPPMRKGLRVTPLCGRLWAHSWALGGPKLFARPMDADDAAFILASAFEESGAEFSQIDYPLFAANRPQAEATMDEHCPFHANGRWRDNYVPRLAIIGVGSVNRNSGHRIADLYRQKPAHVDQYLRRASDDLMRVIQTCERHALPPFADIVNRYFPALDLPTELRRWDLKDRARAIEGLVRSLNLINQRIVAAQWRHLKQTKSIVAMAGGGFKLHALWTVLLAGRLNKTKRLVTEVTTDAETAQALLTALREYRASDKDMQDWYRHATSKLFVDGT